MWASLSVLGIAAVLTAAAAYWVLRAYRRAGGSSVRAAFAACGAVAVAALTIYLVLGRPELPGQAYAMRIEALKQRDPNTYTGEEWLALLEAKAKEDPADALAHFYAGQILLQQNRPQEAARAFSAALRREPELAEAMLGLGQALIQIDGAITPQALALFEQASALSQDPAPSIYLATAAMERGDDVAARRYWGEALVRMSPDDPRREMAAQMSRQ